ncbi:hypothetical protein Cpir12675_001951 [Ceratocystis pirilliformis]|uniref:Kinetochore-associated protein MTW1 n=1 Tax=Ceratocystis pirilliformis TaxID=259994 RepID=A0ABR3ZCB4_9PEZI
MADATANTEILTEHFGYPPVSLLDDIINAINILAESALMSIEQGLLRSPPAALGFRPPRKNKSKKNKAPPEDIATTSVEEAARFEIDNGTHQLETLLCSSIDRNFDIFELYVMRNILSLRPDDRAWMRLRHYDGLDFSRLDDPDAPSVVGVATLRRKVSASQRLTAKLQAEKAQNNALLTTLRGLVERAVIKPDPDAQVIANGDSTEIPTSAPTAQSVTGPLAFLQATEGLGTADATAPLQTTAAFALSQLPALRALSISLRSIAADLQPPADADADDGSGPAGGETPSRRSWRKSRVEYIEIATRKHMERARGLELGLQGEVRDGEWQGAGRKISMAEVEGLESVLALMGGPVGGSGEEEHAMQGQDKAQSEGQGEKNGEAMDIS